MATGKYIPLKFSRDGAQEGQRVANNNNPSGV